MCVLCEPRRGHPKILNSAPKAATFLKKIEQEIKRKKWSARVPVLRAKFQ